MALTPQQMEEAKNFVKNYQQKANSVPTKSYNTYNERMNRLKKIVVQKTEVSKIREKEGEKGVAGVAVGAGKGVISTLTGASGLGERILGSIWKTILPKSAERAIGITEKTPTLGWIKKPTEPVKTSAEELVPEELRTPQGTAEKIGFGIEQVGELFIPIPGLQVSKAAKGASLLEKIFKGGKAIVKEGVELAGKTAIQSGGDIEETKEAAKVGFVGGVFGKVLLEPIFKFVAPSVAKYLEKTNLRLTPVQKQNLGKTTDEVVDFIQRNKVVGSPETRYQKVKTIYEKTEDDLQNFLNQTAKDKFIDKNKFIEELNGIKLKYQNERDILAIEKQIDSVIDTIKTKYPDQIPVARLNEFKRSTYANAYNKAGDKVLDTVEHDIGDVSRINIENSLEGLTINGKSIQEFNKEYGTIINTKKLLKIAQSRKQISMMGKIIALSIGGSIGSAIGGPIGSAVGFAAGSAAAEKAAGTWVRSNFAQLLSLTKKIPPELLESIFTKGALQYLRQKEE